MTSRNGSTGVKAISLHSLVARLAVGAAAAFVVVLSAFAFLWGFASAATSNAEFKEVGDLLASLSPADPQTHFTAGSLHERALEPGDIDAALREYEIAASLAPHNYLLWLRLASVRGRAGDPSGAEAALLQAKRLAPNYSRVQWALGNFLLRDGRDDEAYPELIKAVAGDPSLARLAAATSLQVSDGDAQFVRSKFEDSPPINVALAVQLAGQKRLDEAVELWNLTDTADESYREDEKRLRSQLIENKKFIAAVSMRSTAEPEAEPNIGEITNPGFENPVKVDGADVFEWRVSRGTYPQVGLTDTQKLTGNYSLVVLMSGPNPADFRGPAQQIAVRPGSYQLIVPYRSDVNSAASFHWEVTSAHGGRRLAISPPLAPTQQWTKAFIDFAVPQNEEGIEIRFVRGECAGTKCSASGSFWFDDLLLKAK